MKNQLKDMVTKRQLGIHCGIPSFCCANKLVIEAILDQAKRFDDTVLIEATSNQVNQYGGYTKMRPKDFRNFVYQIADKIEFSRDKIILGGDHLGPLPWLHLPEVIHLQRTIGKADAQQGAVAVQGEQVVIGIGKTVIDRHLLMPAFKIHHIQDPAVRRIIHDCGRFLLIDCRRPASVAGDADRGSRLSAPQYGPCLDIVCLQGTLPRINEDMRI